MSGASAAHNFSNFQMTTNNGQRRMSALTPAARRRAKLRAALNQTQLSLIPANNQAVIRTEGHMAAIHTFSFFDFMILPEEYTPMRVPDGHAGVTAVFKSPFVVSLPYSGTWNAALAKTDPAVDGGGLPVDGYSEVILVPGSTNCIYHTLGDAAILWDDSGAGPGVLVPCLAAHPSISDFIDGRVYMSHGMRGVNTASVAAVLPKRDSAGIPWYEVHQEAVDPSVAWILALRFNNLVMQQQFQANATVAVRYDDDSIETLAVNAIISGVDAKFTIPTGATSGNSTIEAISFSVDDTDTASHWIVRIEAINTGNNSAAASLLARSATAFAVKSAPELDQLNETLTERQTALSGLITYVGSTLQDGGQVAAARLGLGLSPMEAPDGDVFTYLASLPFYNNDYALREGIYGWWLPDSLQEHFYRPYRKPRADILEEDSLLHFAMRRDNPNQDVRLKSIHCVEVVTRSRLYASKPGPTNPSYEVMISALKHAPAITINSKHKGILARAWGAIKKWVSHPANWFKLLKVGGDAVSLVSPAIGSRIADGTKVLKAIVG
jgi:hypothetical protein